MPYISLTERSKFAAAIEEILGVIADPNDTPYIKGEYLGFVVNRVTKKFIGDPTYTQTSFNATFFNESKKKALSNAADSLAVMVNRADPIHSAGDLHYALSAVYLGFLGHAKGFGAAPYGLKVYLRGILERVLSTIETANVGSQRDMAMIFRRHLIVRGVLADVVADAERGATLVPVGAEADAYLAAHPDQTDFAIWNQHGELALGPTTTAIAKA